MSDQIRQLQVATIRDAVHLLEIANNLLLTVEREYLTMTEKIIIEQAESNISATCDGIQQSINLS